jgi:mannosyl-3-phosphoglycerate synthase
MNITLDTVRFTHLFETDHLHEFGHFLSRTAFVVSHKSESIETLLSVLWYLPINSTIILVTNCPETEKDRLISALQEQLTQHRHVYVVHQKDAAIANFFAQRGVHHLLGSDGKVVNGKGEGMYIGALMALLLQSLDWIIYYDADNFVPSALLEYSLAFSRLFLAQSDTTALPGDLAEPLLHNVRICWSSKPSLDNQVPDTGVMGRCSRVVSPIFTTLVQDRFGIHDQSIITSNAGEQGYSLYTAAAIRFSSGYAVETFQLLDLLALADKQQDHLLFQQYQARSPHFHDKKDDHHIKRMIEDSLGSFYHFKDILPESVERELDRIYDEQHLDFRLPVIYPPLREIMCCTPYSDLSADMYKLSWDRVWSLTN